MWKLIENNFSQNLDIIEYTEEQYKLRWASSLAQ
jgi:hypothetical protein